MARKYCRHFGRDEIKGEKNDLRQGQRECILFVMSFHFQMSVAMRGECPRCCCVPSGEGKLKL